MTEKKSEMEAIAQTIQLYFDGMYYSDAEKLNQAFHPESFLTGHVEGNTARISFEDWKGMVAKTPPPAENGEEYDMRIVSIDVTGLTASVKVADLYRATRYTDYLSLVKLDDTWQIVNKIFHHEPKE